jgi:hypothetical protein
VDDTGHVAVPYVLRKIVSLSNLDIASVAGYWMAKLEGEMLVNWQSEQTFPPSCGCGLRDAPDVCRECKHVGMGAVTPTPAGQVAPKHVSVHQIFLC